LRRSEALAGELRWCAPSVTCFASGSTSPCARKLFAARSETSSAQQRDLFFNEAEVLGVASEPAACNGHEEDSQEVRVHQRVLCGRKPLDAALPREVVRHELPEAERVCPHDGAALVEIGVQASEQLDIVPQQVGVIRHERVKYACPCCDGACAWRPSQHLTVRLVFFYDHEPETANSSSPKASRVSFNALLTGDGSFSENPASIEVTTSLRQKLMTLVGAPNFSFSYRLRQVGSTPNTLAKPRCVRAPRAIFIRSPWDLGSTVFFKIIAIITLCCYNSNIIR